MKQEIGNIIERTCESAKTYHQDDVETRLMIDDTPQLFSLVLDLTSNNLQEYLSSVVDDFNPAAKTSLGIGGYADKLTRYGRTIAAVTNTLNEEKVIGILAGYFNDPAKGFSFVSAFHVRIPFRRMHIGRVLMDKAIEISRNEGFKELRLRVDKDNVAALAFYKRHGFVNVGEAAKQFAMSYYL